MRRRVALRELSASGDVVPETSVDTRAECAISSGSFSDCAAEASAEAAAELSAEPL